jgi:hypothetical protein
LRDSTSESAARAKPANYLGNAASTTGMPAVP